MIMSGPTRKTISIVGKDVSPGCSDHEILSVELLPGAFTIAILDSVQYRYQLLEVYQTENNILRYETVTDLLANLIDSNPYLQKVYSKVNISYYSPHLVLVPKNVSEQEDQESAYKFSCFLPAGHSIKVDRLNNLDAFGVYAIPDSLFDNLNQLFPSNKIYHSGSSFIESILATLNLEKWHPDIVLHIRQTYFEVMLIENNTIGYYKLFIYQGFDDLLYYLFYVLQQFKKDALNMQLLLAGEISLDSDSYERIASYFKVAQFVGRSDAYKYAAEFDSIPYHYFFNLLNLNSCG